MPGITFLVGGVRSGKSSLAVDIGRRHDGPVVFLATAEPFDDDMRARIDRHRTDRPSWPVVDAPLALGAAIAKVDVMALLIVDCLTVWVGNLLHAGETTESIHGSATDVVERLRSRSGPTVVVSNEVGMGVHPSSALGRTFRDVLGGVNQVVGRAADRTLLLVAGRAIPLVDPHVALR